ncbi:unnamed protein product, partial [Ectocarpus sp. 4 AP-2014]
ADDLTLLQEYCLIPPQINIVPRTPLSKGHIYLGGTPCVLCASLEGEGSSFTTLNYRLTFHDCKKNTAKMDTLGIEATPEEVDLMIDEIDQDNNGEIDFEEFVAVMSRKVNASYTADQVKSAFKVFEGNSPPGHIRIESVMKALTTYGSEQLTEEQAHDLVSQLEPDHNGVVNYVEYINMV